MRSEKVIVPSKAVVGDFKKVYAKIPISKYALAYEGVDPVFLDSKIDPKFVLEKYNIQKPFLLYVSSMYEHKNVPRLLEAFEILVKSYGFGGELVLIGKRDKFSENIAEIVRIMNLGKKVVMPGMNSYVSDEEIVALRKEAILYVFPSLKEGFSLTPLEAQAVDLPCVISNIDVHKEIYGYSVVYFDPHDTDDIARNVSAVLNDSALRSDLIEKGRQNLDRYDWEVTADVTLEVFRSVFDHKI